MNEDIGAATHSYFFETKHRVIANQWESFKGYTVRPLESTEAHYLSEFLDLSSKNGDASQIMIYGGTPEIRDCAYKIGAKTTLVDRSRMMVEAMGSLTVFSQALSPNEQFVETDWLNILLPDESFDIIAGDDSINMVDWINFSTYLNEAFRLLRPGGSFLCHLLVKPSEDLINQSIEQVVENYETNSKFDYASEVNFAHYDHETYRMGWQRSIAGLQNAIKEGKIDDDKGFINLFKTFNSSFTCPPQTEFEDLISNLENVSIENVFYPTEYRYCQFEPLYHLRKGR